MGRELAARKTLASLSVKHCKLIAPHLAAFSLATAAAARLEGQLSMPEMYDDEDEVGTGLYVLIGCAAVTVALMYSWIGYTLYQGFKARRKVD